MFTDGVPSRPAYYGSHRLVVFDLDGTLIDSKPVMVHAFRTAYAEVVGRGEAPVDSFLRLLGAPFPEILARLGLPHQMYEPFRAASRAGIEHIRAHEDVLTVCEAVRDAGCRTAIYTGKDRERTVEILDRFGLWRLCDGIAVGDDPQAGKPAPDGVYQLCRTLAADPVDTVVVGDSALDMQAGRAAGAGTVGCLWGIGTEEELRSAGADVVVADPLQLQTALARWRQRTGMVMVEAR
ncbi:HAD family hydrolase [Micromonospora sp. KC721]|nr:HAD family hydrolase [Micromonospora sp. KC721]